VPNLTHPNRNLTSRRSGAGTVTHLAPELLEAGSKVTTAVDTWAFGILMYEAYSGGSHPYSGLTR
jgi:serine/threonine protein kinase